MVWGSECNDKHGDLFHGGNLSSTWLLNIKASPELLGGTQNMTALLGRYLFYLSSIIFIHIFRPCLFVTWIPGCTWMDLYFEFYGVGNILINMNTAELELHKNPLMVSKCFLVMNNTLGICQWSLYLKQKSVACCIIFKFAGAPSGHKMKWLGEHHA